MPALRATFAYAAAGPAGAADESGPVRADPLIGAIRSWSLVHGFAMLEIDGFMPNDWQPDALLAAVLAHRRA